MNAQNVKTALTIPCHWDKKIIKQIIDQNVKLSEGGVFVTEIYGALAHGGPIGHGRSQESVSDVSKEEALDYRRFLKQAGLNFTYLLNAPFKFIDENQAKEVNQYLEWIIKELKPDALTITSLELMKQVRKIDSLIPIHISTIAGVKNAKDLEKYLDVKPNRIVPHHDCGKRFSDLKGIVELSKKHGIDVEILATESCLFKCPYREAHYRQLSKTSRDEVFHTSCNTRKLTKPREFLLAGGTIRPEDLKLYEDMGVKYFKITGRSKPATWLPEVVKAYQERSYDGNLIRLLGIDPSMKAEEWIYIDNKALDGFIERFPQTGKSEDEIMYANSWTNKLYKEGKFKLLDGTEYAIERDELLLKEAGKNTEQVFCNEFRKGMK